MLQCSPPVDFIVGKRNKKKKYDFHCNLHTSWEWQVFLLGGKVLPPTPRDRFSVEEVIVIARFHKTAFKLCILYNVNSFFSLIASELCL